MEELKEKARLAREKAEAAKLAAGGGQDAADAKKAALEAARKRAELEAARAKDGAGEAAKNSAALEQAESAAKEKVAAEKAAMEIAQAAKAAEEKAAKAAEEAANDRAALEQAEKTAAERLASEKAAAEKVAKEKANAEKVARERMLAEQAAKEKAAAEKAMAEKVSASKAAAEKAASEKLEREKEAAAKAARDKAAEEEMMAERAASQKVASEKALADRKAVEKASSQKALEKSSADKAASQRILEKAAEKAASQNMLEKATAGTTAAETVTAERQVALAQSELGGTLVDVEAAIAVGTAPQVAVGLAVKVAYDLKTLYGMVRFVGVADFAEGDVVGIAFEKPMGKNDGSVMGKRYFQCAPRHGLFVRPRAIISVGTSFENLVDVPDKSSKSRSKNSTTPARKSARSSKKKKLDASRGIVENINSSFVAISPVRNLESAISPVRNLQSAFVEEALAEKRKVQPQTSHRQPGTAALSPKRGGEQRQVDRGSGMPELNALWSALGNVSYAIKLEASKWIERRGMRRIDDLFGRVEDFLSALALKPVQRRKAEDFFRSRGLQKTSQPRATGAVAPEALTGFGELDKTLQQALKNNLARIKLNVLQPHCTEDTVVDVFGAMRECFVDLSKIISKVVNAKVWSSNTTDSLGKGDTFLRIAEMEKNMRDFIEEQVTTATLDVVSLIAESENRLRSFVKESVDDAVSTQLAKNNLGSMTSRSGVPKYTSDFHADAKRNWFSRGNEQSYKDAFEVMGGSQAVNKCRHITENLIVNDPLLESQVWQLLPKNCQSNDSRSKLVHQHFTLSLDTLFAEAQVVSQSFMSRVSELAKKTGGEACLLQPTPCECAKLKIKWEHGRDAWHRMTDITAARVVYPSIERMYQGLEATRDIFKGRIHELVDGYVKPSSSGFRELSLVVEHANHMCRLRLNTSSMTEAEETLRARVLEIQNDLERAIDDGSLQDCFSLLRWSTQLGIELGALPTFRGLHHAAGRGHGAICCALLEHQANVNAIDADGNSPLHLAAKGGHDSAVWALLDRGKADSLLSNSRNETPLLIAALLLHRQPANKGAMDTVLVLAQAAGADHVRQVVLRLEELLSDNANIPLETF